MARLEPVIERKIAGRQGDARRAAIGPDIDDPQRDLREGLIGRDLQLRLGRAEQDQRLAQRFGLEDQ